MLGAMAIFVLAATADGQPRLSTPIATISRADLMDAAYTGVGVAASMAGAATGVVAVADTSLVLLEGAEGSINAGNDVVEQRLLVITSNREKLEKLRAEGRLHRGDPAYDVMRQQLQRESTIAFPRTRDFVTRALLSREGLIAFGRASLAFGVRSFLGDRIVDIFGPGIRVRSLMSTYASRDRSVPRSAWKRIDGIARACGRLIDELTEVAVDESVQAVEAAAEEPPQCGPMTIAAQSSWVNGVEMMRPAVILNIPCKEDLAPVQAVPAVIAVQPMPVQFVATPTRELTAARPTVGVVPIALPVLLPPPVTGQFEPPPAGTPRLGSAYEQAVDRRFNWKE
jgi:hypothetical protein